MSDPKDKTAVKSSDAEPANYSEDLPETPEERDRAVPGFAREVAAQQKGADPRDAATPYDGVTFNGTTDSSRFSTPPPRKT